MKFALCDKPATPRISEALWNLISNGGTPPNPRLIFIEMDYHLNWLYAALANAARSADAESPENKKLGPFPNEWQLDKKEWPAIGDRNQRPIQNNQEDVDLLVAWFDRRWAKPFRLVLIEAKLDSSWDSKQFEKKRERLTLIKEDADKLVTKDFIQWNFVLLSPGNGPSRGPFANKDPDHERYEWLYQGINGEPREGLWHENLEKIGGQMRVKRTSASSDEWEIEAIKGGGGCELQG
ncbi:hypothetical protein HFP89_08250 [Wenzhouxiangella sp. XN79A]|uniref:hypothetical protein n=1 Tax=Wenzhouxiangella sp. XN79A TaxID=2724193 RepID=UPI00144A58E0|nr:hypothetical protein [Wenzhouxiangella sp. XN79A]NKI35155.1 hypothetical protein [Wenzhouxiangella sp. XN79A]